eukprot:127202-Prymnesium_polylepis.2
MKLRFRTRFGFGRLPARAPERGELAQPAEPSTPRGAPDAGGSASSAAARAVDTWLGWSSGSTAQCCERADRRALGCTRLLLRSRPRALRVAASSQAIGAAAVATAAAGSTPQRLVHHAARAGRTVRQWWQKAPRAARGRRSDELARCGHAPGSCPELRDACGRVSDPWCDQTDETSETGALRAVMPCNACAVERVGCKIRTNAPGPVGRTP